MNPITPSRIHKNDLGSSGSFGREAYKNGSTDKSPFSREAYQSEKKFKREFAPLTKQWDTTQKEWQEMNPNYHCWSAQDSLWKDHAVWEHGTNALGYAQYDHNGVEKTHNYPHNRYYSR